MLWVWVGRFPGWVTFFCKLGLLLHFPNFQKVFRQSDIWWKVFWVVVNLLAFLVLCCFFQEPCCFSFVAVLFKSLLGLCQVTLLSQSRLQLPPETSPMTKAACHVLGFFLPTGQQLVYFTWRIAHLESSVSFCRRPYFA